jgi:hypothetical protein
MNTAAVVSLLLCITLAADSTADEIARIEPKKSPFILFSKSLQTRGQLEVKGSFEMREVRVTINNQPEVSSRWELAVSKVSISSRTGKLCEAELIALPKADQLPFKDLTFLAAQDTPQHTCFVYTFGSTPMAMIFDHTTSPPAIRKVQFSEDMEKALRYDRSTAVINFNAKTPSEVQIVFTTTNGSVTARISLLTGLVLEK